ncbi:MAG TPA: FMN-binding protein [Tissierellaceae bacterium]|nr:FMN-binding protein [Tissierellaceae bacterium]
MKKNKFIFIIFCVLSLVLTACTGKDKIEYRDGSFDAEAEPDENGWKGQISIKVEGGKIAKVDYDEIDSAGEKKSKDTDYAKAMESSSGVTPADAFKQLEEALINSQDPDKIEAVSGATASSASFKKLAKEVLEGIK